MQTQCCKTTRLLRAVYVLYMPSAEQVPLNPRRLGEDTQRSRPRTCEGFLDSCMDVCSSRPHLPAKTKLGTKTEPLLPPAPLSAGLWLTAPPDTRAHATRKKTLHAGAKRFWKVTRHIFFFLPINFINVTNNSIRRMTNLLAHSESNLNGTGHKNSLRGLRWMPSLKKKREGMTKGNRKRRDSFM